MSLEFLRRDCVNINDYFKKMKATTLASMSIFNFVTSIIADLRNPKIKTDADLLSKIIREDEEWRRDPNFLENDKVFEKMYIPQSI